MAKRVLCRVVFICFETAIETIAKISDKSNEVQRDRAKKGERERERAKKKN